MLKCPFCGFDNEEGSLFCEQCKSDLSAVAAAPSPVPVPPIAQAPPVMAAVVASHIPMAQVQEALPMAPIVDAGQIPMANVWEAAPQAMPDLIPIAPMPTAQVEMPSAGFHLGEMPQAEIPTGPTVAEAFAMPMATPEVAPAYVPPAAPAPAAPMPTAPTPVAPVMAQPFPAGVLIPPQAPAPAPVAPAPVPAAPAVAPTKGAIPPGSTVKLAVRRGQRVGVEYNVFPDFNYIGRADDKPVDIDLEDQEPPDRVWCSRQHAVLHYDDTTGILTIEDLNSSNGTYVNRNKVYPGTKQPLQIGDVVQIGTIHLMVKV